MKIKIILTTCCYKGVPLKIDFVIVAHKPVGKV